MFNLPSAPAFCPLPRFHPLHPPFSVCPIFLLLVFEPSSSPPHRSLLYLSSHYFSGFFFFLQLIVGVSRSTFWVFAPQCHRFTAPHWSTFSARGACGVCTYHTQVDWREGLWHWQIIERVQHVVQVIFLGETDKQWKQKARNDTRVWFVSVVDAAQCINLNNGAGTEAAADQRAILQQGPEPSKTSDWHMFNEQRRG